VITTALIVTAYLIGSVSFAVVVSKFSGLPDPHSYGSGNPGATNVLRTGNKLAALLTLIGDAVKGWLAVWITMRLSPILALPEWVVPGAALAVFVGHLFPIFHRFHGGKGVATALGVLLAINLQLGLGVLFIWLVVFLIWRVSSLAALAAAIFAPLFTIHFFGYGSMVFAVAAMAVLLIWRHHANIANLITGSEKRIETH
jgi:acyl phosphate:glycerol-3-phosphate acyltransferase